MITPKRILVVAVALTAAASFVTAHPATGDPFTCRGSLARTEGFPISALNQEPVVANPNNNPCQSENVAVIDALNPLVLPGGLGTVRALYAQTDANGGGFAQAGVAETTLNLPTGDTIRAAALTSSASSACARTGKNAPPPTLSGTSTILFVQINDDPPIVNLSDARTISLPGGGTLFLNQRTTTADTVTQRALRAETPLGTVTIAESIADFRGNPCRPGDDDDNGGGGPNDPPECSDERDNDRDGKIDYPNDPGCDSPQDDDERDGGQEPECSDGEDNDGDGDIDYPADPGCENRDDDDETNNDDPECSDGVDNDGDGRIDHPADTGCTSPTDDDEAAGFVTGGGGYDETDRKISNEDLVEPGSSVRFGGVAPCDLGQNPGPNLVASFHDPQMVGRFKLGTLTRAFCRNDPYINPGKPRAEFDTYVGEGTGTVVTATGAEIPGVNVEFILIDRGEPGAPPVTGVDFFSIRVFQGPVTFFNAVGSLDHGNVQAHTPNGQFRNR